MAFITPDWPAPNHIKSVITTRQGGVSQAPWNGFNLATHVNDDEERVKQNRQQLINLASLPTEPEWLNQTHSTMVVHLDKSSERHADASITQKNNQIAVVLTADCLPLLVCNQAGTEVAAIHAGWKGLLDGIVSQTIQQMQSNAADLLVYLGPAISQANFEVGAEVKQPFCVKSRSAKKHFKPVDDDKFLANLYGLARDELTVLGVKHVYGGRYCSFAQEDQFYSYRRDGVTGRMASMIWMAGMDFI